MSKRKADKKEDIGAAGDRGESVTLMAPMRLGEDARGRGELLDLAIELASKTAGFRRSLPGGVVRALADLVRAMNCYYSNLIEGHDTHPVDIERALKEDYSADPRRRNLQLEARAHITVQRWIDEGNIKGRATAAETIKDIHRRFCELLPDELLWVEDAASKKSERIIGGELRKRDVQVGRHVAISPGAIPRFLAEFERSYAAQGKAEAILATAAAHHRLLWIHPFLDGNGRVSRLMSHAMLLDLLDTGGLWSVSRGLARSASAYKAHLANCDLPRRNDLDGRGNLSEEALTGFTRYFLEVCLDQVGFMESLVQPDRLRARILIWTEEEIRLGALPPKAGQVLEAILYRGQLPRGDVSGLLGLTPRHARRIVAQLVERGVLISESARTPLYLAFPAVLASRWMPGLFPERAGKDLMTRLVEAMRQCGARSPVATSLYPCFAAHMSTSKNPWLDIPLTDYEQHMALPENGQAQMLAKELGGVVEECHPKSVAIIGCAGGNGFECLLGHGLERVVGVDINPTYIDTFRRRCSGAFSRVESYVADIQLGGLRFPPVDLVFVALVFEFVDLDKTIKALRPLCLPGGCFTVILQMANQSLEAVTPSPYTSLQKLAPILRLLEPEVFVSSAQASGFTLEGHKHLELPSGKQFCRLTFRASSSSVV